MSTWDCWYGNDPETYSAGMPEARMRATPRLATSRELPALLQRVPRASHRTGVGVVADLSVQEVENLGGVVAELGRFFLDVRVGRAGIGGEGQQGWIRDIARF